LDQILVQSGAGGGGGGGGGGRGASETVNSGVKSKLSIRRPEGGGVFFMKLEEPESKLDLVYVRSLAKSVQNKTGSNWSFGSRL
jgi:hypothetical protein